MSSTKCRVTGCTSCKPGKSHFCDVCKDKDSTHRARDHYKMCNKLCNKETAHIVSGMSSPDTENIPENFTYCLVCS